MIYFIFKIEVGQLMSYKSGFFPASGKVFLGGEVEAQSRHGWMVLPSCSVCSAENFPVQISSY